MGRFNRYLMEPGCCSMWQDYLKIKRSRKVRKWLEANSIPLESIHTSGHASVADLQRFAAALASCSFASIYSFETDRFTEFFDNVVRREPDMSPVDRKLDDDFVETLNCEYKKEASWWKRFVDDAELFLTIRENEVYVYYRSSRILQLKWPQRRH